MRINHNIAALDAYSKLSRNQDATQSVLEKLSSGLRINRAADDAAGLAISEKMRGQISGLDQANRNAQDGISLIQTAEGALSETQAMLQRMRELAVQSANDTNTATDRQNIQKEVDQLSIEITRIANTTEFNQQNLLNGGITSGNVGAITLQIGANTNQTMSIDINAMDAKSLGVTRDVTTKTGTASGQISSTLIDNNNLGSKVVSGAVITFTYTSGTPANVTLSDGTNSQVINIADPTVSSLAVTSGDFAGVTINMATGKQLSNLTTGDRVTISATTTAATAATFSNGVKTADAVSAGGIDVSSSAAAASTAITSIDNAIQLVSAERAKFGAFQNRLEHTVNNLAASSQNLTSAESRIRDADMAQEMTEFTKLNIINQSATAMLAQANQLPQGVLQLLKG